MFLFALVLRSQEKKHLEAVEQVDALLNVSTGWNSYSCFSLWQKSPLVSQLCPLAAAGRCHLQ